MEISSWNLALIAVGAIMVINIIVGYRKGLVKEVINCISLLVSSATVVLLSSVLKSYTSKQFVEMLILIIMVLVVSIANKLIKMLLEGIKVISELPVISLVNKLAGAAFGVAQTILIVWFAFCLIGMFDLGIIGEYIQMYIGDSEILTLLYENNILAGIGEKVLGSEFQMKTIELIMEQGKDIVDNIL